MTSQNLIDGLRLRPLQPDDCGLVLVWRNRPEVRRGMFTSHEIAEPEHAAWFARVLVDDSLSYFIAEHRARPIGIVGFYAIDHRHRRGEWSFHIGEYDTPKGAGTAMGALAIDQYFARYAFDKLCCSVLSDNAASLAMHARLGFVTEGLHKRHVWREGAAHDVHDMALFREVWEARRGHAARLPRATAPA